MARRTRGAALAAVAAVALVGCAPGDAGSPAVVGDPGTATGPATGTTTADTDAASGPSAPASAWTGRVTHVADGDTLWVEVVTASADSPAPGEEAKLRLLRIDTPELGRDGDPAECFAEAARDHLRRLLPEGTEVALAYDVETVDRYGRDLVHLWRVSDGLWVNGAMLADGFARVVTFPPNVAHDDEVRELQDLARRESRGLWSAC